MNENALGQKRSGRAARQAARKIAKSSAVRPGLEGGFYRSLSEADVKHVHGAVLEVLAIPPISNPGSMKRSARATRSGSGPRICAPAAGGGDTGAAYATPIGFSPAMVVRCIRRRWPS